MEKMNQQFSTTTQISGTHGGSKMIAIDFSEALHLDRTNQCNQNIGCHIPISGRKKSNRSQCNDFQQNDDLSPVEPAAFLEAAACDFGYKDAGDESPNRDEILLCFLKLSTGQIHRQKNQIAGLRIGKDTPSS